MAKKNPDKANTGKTLHHHAYVYLDDTLQRLYDIGLMDLFRIRTLPAHAHQIEDDYMMDLGLATYAARVAIYRKLMHDVIQAGRSDVVESLLQREFLEVARLELNGERHYFKPPTKAEREWAESVGATLDRFTGKYFFEPGTSKALLDISEQWHDYSVYCTNALRPELVSNAVNSNDSPIRKKLHIILIRMGLFAHRKV